MRKINMRLLSAGLSALLAVPVIPPKTATAETYTLNFTESTEIDTTPCDCGYTSTAWISAKPGKDWSMNVTRYTLLLIGIGGYSSGMGGTDADFDSIFFTSFENTLKSARSNGAMVGIRLRYDDNGTTNPEPATFEQVERHIAQIGESGLLDEYSDVISFVETGTVGSWGEQWGGLYTSLEYKARVLDDYLKIVPAPIPVTVRTPNTFRQWLKDYCGVTVSADNMGEDVQKFIAQGTENSQNAARVGLYNDGYMGSDSDLGTYSNRNGETDWLHFAQAYGGEFSGADEWRMKYTTWQPENAIAEMYKTDLTRINSNIYKSKTATEDFDTEAEAKARLDEIKKLYEACGLGGMDCAPTLTKTDEGKYQASWKWFGYNDFTFTEELDKKLGVDCDNSAFYGRDCWTFIRSHIGYRYVLRSLDMTSEAKAGGDFSLGFTVENTGFAEAPSDKEAEILLTNGSITYTLTTDIQPEDWLSEETANESVRTELPKTMPGGDWQVYLRISNENTDHAYDTSFCTKLANADMQYNDSLGANLIGTIAISGKADESKPETADKRPAGYYPDAEPVTIDESSPVALLDKTYTFTEDGHYGFTFLYKIEGVDSEIQLGNWYDGFKIGTTGYSSAWTTYGLNTMNLKLTKDGCYALHIPFYACAFNCTVPTIADDSELSALTINDSRNYWSEDTFTQLGGNSPRITPIGFVEGGPSGYDVTFHLAGGDERYTGDYGFTDELSQSIKNAEAVTVMSLLKGTVEQSYTDEYGTWKFKGFTTKEGDSSGIISDELIAIGTMELYPYYELDSDATDLNKANYSLTNGADFQGVRYTLNADGTAMVGDGSAWENNSGFAGGSSIIIPTKVTSDGKTYTVTAVGSNAFAGDTELKTAALPDSVKAIGTNAFPEDTVISGGAMVYGDANGDGFVSVADPTLIMQSAANPDNFVIKDADRPYADVIGGGDGITAEDALTIQKFLSGTVISLPVIE